MTYQTPHAATHKSTSDPLKIKSPIFFYYETTLNTSDKQPVVRIDTASNVVAVRVFRNNTSAPGSNGTISIRRNGSEIYSLSIATGDSHQTWVTKSTSNTALSSGDSISAVVTGAGSGITDITIALDIEQTVI